MATRRNQWQNARMELKTSVPVGKFDPASYQPEGVLTDILEACRALEAGAVIALHGWPGTGKTPTAIWLARKLGVQVIHLDDYNLKSRPNFDPETDKPGFDECAMRQAISVRKGTVVVEGVCAARVCEPDVLVLMGEWPGARLSQKLTSFIGDYKPKP